MNADDREDFLSRWSRLKKAVRAEKKPAEPKLPAAAAQPAVANPQGAAAPSSEAQTPLPSIDSLKGLASDYAGFLKPDVDENLKRAALKKLFSDPHFENFERFEAYCEDYTQGEPIPLAMLRALEHAKGLLFDEEKKEKQDAPKEGAPPSPQAEKVPDVPVKAKTETPAVAAEPPKEA